MSAASDGWASVAGTLRRPCETPELAELARRVWFKNGSLARRRTVMLALSLFLRPPCRLLVLDVAEAYSGEEHQNNEADLDARTNILSL